jgi:pimeloyl-ACP methyl ester carboxylesterase
MYVEMSTMRVLMIAGLVLAALALLWTALAWNAGMFIPHDERFAVEPSSFTPDVFATRKKIGTLGTRQVAYIDIGQGEPVILLHGCPFSIYEWRDTAPALAKTFRVIAPDLIGLGDTPVRLNEDYRLPEHVKMVQALMDHLGIKSARFIGHDHGGAIVQLLMQHDPGRIDMAILTNVEAYDQWPSKPEIPDLKLITNPITSPLLFHVMQFRAVQRQMYAIAVADPATLTDETLDGFAAIHLANGLRWQRLRRFFDWQLDPAHNRLTLEAVPSVRQFSKPVLILWGEKDTNFGPDIALRLARDIPGVTGLQWMKNSAHLPMLEEPVAYADAAIAFLKDGNVPHSAVTELAIARRTRD